MKRGDIVIEKRTGLKREVETVFYGDGKINFIRTVDPKTGHDLQDHLPEELEGNFEEELGWAPDSDYETIETNDPDGKKQEQMFRNFTKEHLERMGVSMEIGRKRDMSTKCPGSVLGQKDKMSSKGGKDEPL